MTTSNQEVIDITLDPKLTKNCISVGQIRIIVSSILNIQLQKCGMTSLLV